MRIVVTGRSGQLVKSLLERAQRRGGIEVVPLGRPQVDLETPSAIGRVVAASEPDLVINAAAYTAVDQAEDEPELASRVNGEAAGALAAAAREVGAEFIQISTDYVFDGILEEPYREDALVRPLGVYGRSKLLGEELVREAHPGAAIVRTSWVYSPFGRNFVKTMLTLARDRDKISVVEDQRGCPTSALDLAEGLIRMGAAWGGGSSAGKSGTYHLTGSGDASWAEFATFIFEQAALHGLPSAEVEPIPAVAWPTRAPRPKNSVLDSARFERDFGYRAPEWRRSVAEVVERLAPLSD